METEDAISKFLLKCSVRSLSTYTIQTYSNSLRIFAEWYGQRDLMQLVEDDIDDYTYYLKTKYDNMVSVKRKLNDLRVFLNYAYGKEWCLKIKVTIPKIQEPEIIPLTDQQLHDLYDACLIHRSTDRLRDYIIMRILEETGMRISELLRVSLDDISGDSIPLRKTKNKRNRHAYLTPRLQKEISQYLSVRKSFMRSHSLINANPWIITRESQYSTIGDALRVRTIQGRIKRYGEQAGITNVRVSPHTFRHTFARNFLVNGGDMLTLQELLGHETLDMVRRYVYFFDTDRKKTYLDVMAKREKVRKRNNIRPIKI